MAVSKNLAFWEHEAWWHGIVPSRCFWTRHARVDLLSALGHASREYNQTLTYPLRW